MSAGVVRLAPFWAAVAQRLDSPRMQTLLGGAGRVSREGMPRYEGAESAQWGRVILVPSTRLWPDTDTRGLSQYVSWLVRAESNALDDAAIDPLVHLEAIQAEAYTRLQGWDAGAFTHARIVLPVWRQSVPQPTPMWEETDGVWWLSAEYRCEASGWFVPDPTP